MTNQSSEIPGNGRKSKSLRFSQPPQRVVSLVPSLTESMFDLGLGAALVGVTDYCIHPAEGVAGLPRLGGPKNPRLAEILELQPDLVMANWEENTRQAVEALEANGVAVWVTFPRSVNGALEVLWKLAELFRSQAAMARLTTLELTMEWATSAARERQPARYFCPIWQERTADGLDWWMTFNRATYCDDLLGLLGYQNVFSDRQRRYPLEADLGLAEPQDPGERDTRYPRVTLHEIRAAQPEIILLPSEPFAFDEAQREQLAALLADTPAAQQGRLYLVDGSLITWHGTRLARALRDLPPLLSGE
ncbi:MAG: ABC transporter substrate-binding protein [Anaerolineales bacterium]|nr:ABC transporter substrate-binding protein [Anaerolineales bacterium]